MRIRMTEQTDYVWHVYIPNLGLAAIRLPRLRPLRACMGHRFNPSKLLLDPYAKAITGRIDWSDALFGYPMGLEDPDRDLLMDTQDSAPGMNRSVVIDPAFDWGDDRSPNIPLHESIIYEVHVKGFTAQHPGIDPKVRGTYSGLATPQSIDYLKALGVTAVELLPVHHFVNDKTLVDKGLSNYWGYNSIGYFAHTGVLRLRQRGEQGEFKAMVKTLHEAGIEVILDVVYNHTPRATITAPPSFKGIDNVSYYRWCPTTRLYMDYTARQHAQYAPPAHAANGHGQLALLGDGDAR